MMNDRKRFSICVPAYNRARYLGSLLDSVLSQDFEDYEIVICEDHSPERAEIRDIVHCYDERHPNKIRYFENPVNLGYDANIRQLVSEASGSYCFFLGNDDLMSAGALSHLHELLQRHPEAGFVLRSYAVFEDNPANVIHELRYFSDERELASGADAITVCYRRSGVISGYIVHRDDAYACATDQFDGTLYYQMHLTVSVLSHRPAISTPRIMVLCRANEPPDFGNSEKEKGIYTPGRYTIEARLSMVRGAMSIITGYDSSHGSHLLENIQHDYANYFYPYILDQLGLPFREYFRLYRGYWSMGFCKYPLFHVYCIGCYILGARRFDAIARRVRKALGHNVRFGIMAK